MNRRRILIHFLLLTIPLAVLCIGVAGMAMLRSRSFFSAVLYIYNTLTIAWPLLMLAAAGLGMALRRPNFVAAALIHAVPGVPARLYATHLEPNLLFVREQVIVTDKVTREVRLVHISDVQSDRIDGNEQRAFERIASLRPDLVIHTGDLLQLPAARLDGEFSKLMGLFSTLTPAGGVWNTMGDVDGPVRDRLRQEGLPLSTLEGENTLIEIPGAGRLRLHGLSLGASRYRDATRLALVPVSDSLNADEFTIVAGHAPDFVLEAQYHPIDLCLAGHTHGGQVRIPFVGPLITLSRVPRRLARGFHEVGSTRLNVSAGIGAEHAAGLPSIRVFCPPEITLIRLVPEN